MNRGLVMLWKVVAGNHLFVFWRGRLIYKQWLDHSGRKVRGQIMYLPTQA